MKLGLDAAIICCWTQQFYACVECQVGEREDTFNGRNGRFRLLTKVKARMNISESENQLVERGIFPVTIDSNLPLHCCHLTSLATLPFSAHHFPSCQFRLLVSSYILVVLVLVTSSSYKSARNNHEDQLHHCYPFRQHPLRVFVSWNE